MTHSVETKPCVWTIKLVLLTLESVISDEANTGIERRKSARDDELEHLLSNCRKSTPCFSARAYLSHDATNTRDGSTCRLTRHATGNSSIDGDCVWEKVCRNIMKFIQRKDRYLALTSILLKSRTFHESYNTTKTCFAIEQHPTNRQFVLPVIDLPRTKYNKPYIPTRFSVSTHRLSSPESSDETTGICPFSLSHQFPFAGLARLVSAPTPNLTIVTKTSQHQSDCPLLVGMDIVVFDMVNFSLYDSILEFCHVFRESFSINEWSAICTLDNDHARLRELYLRWTIKEAYTKALGVGMGCNFASFETILDELTATDQHNNSVWNWVSSQARDCTKAYIKSTARVVNLSADEASTLPGTKTWLFFFLPLSHMKDSPLAELQSLGHPHMFRGCGSVCIGPFANAEEAQFVELNIEWTNLANLMTWHGVS